MNKKFQEPDEIDCDQQLAELNEQLEELTVALQRERADTINIRRQHEMQMSNLRNAAKASVVRELLPVIDNFELAIKHAPQLDAKSQKDSDQKIIDWIKGVEKILNQFEKTLADMGVTRIATVGETFNPNLHEAISMEEGEGDQEIVSDELQAGYQMGDEVLRHAKVRVRVQ
ncbi:MAG TPA: nucleotide exchange factor GrpE [Patescibacteria group bacterium]|nr:nucleotide exchange factor GrpE [Patescibacteria group bacterium]